MKNVTRFATVGLIAITLGYSGLSAQMMRDDQRGVRGGDRNPVSHLLSEIELSDAQKATLESLSESFKEEREAAKEAGSKEQDLADAISQSGLDVTEFVQTEQEHCTARSTMHAQHLEQIIDVLSEDQRLELKTLLETKASEKAAKEAEKIEDLGY